MDARHHVVESVEHLVGVVERPVGQDVALGPLEEVELGAERLVQGVDLGPLGADPLDASARRRSRPTASDRRCRGTAGPGPARPAAISASVADAVAPVGVAVERPLQVVRDRPGREPSRLGGLELAGVFAQLGRDLGQAERLEELGLGPAGDRPPSPARAYSFSDRPRASARFRIAMLCALEPVK